MQQIVKQDPYSHQRCASFLPEGFVPRPPGVPRVGRPRSKWIDETLFELWRYIGTVYATFKWTTR
eukprot:5103428-Prorocentrum_lima.AAC.1